MATVCASPVGTTAFSHPAAEVGSQLFVGRQGIFDCTGGVHAYEFLYRAGRDHTLRVDRWSAAAQDRATLRVLQATFSQIGVQPVASSALVFINFTRSFLVGDLPVPSDPGRLVVEIVESVRVDADVVAGVAALKDAGFRIAIDDFVGLRSQEALLPLADYVKIDRRDLYERGARLVDAARREGVHLIAERVETVEEFDWCQELGFDLFQGNYLEPTQVLNRTSTLGAPGDELAGLRPHAPAD
jgi:c-di-GMP phosphodiesterase